MKRNKTLLLTFSLLILSSCFELQGYKDTAYQDGINGGGLECPVGEVNCSSRGDGSDQRGDDDIVADPKVEIRHLIEPKVDDDSDAGTYLRKLTIPKNYDGLLYVAGINMGTLSSDVIKVRFNFGVDRSAIEIPATVSTASGLIPQTSIQVLILDMKGKPFNNVNLRYDLYDYNDYDFLGSSEASALSEPVNFNRDKFLYCRGLRLEDDNTFDGDPSVGCSQESDTCKHTYIKVVDQGLVRDDTVDIPVIPEFSQTDSMGTGYYSDDTDVALGKCLPDAPASFRFSDTVVFNSFNDIEAIGGVNYIYRGPYRAINLDGWEVFGSAITGEYGIFREFESTAVQAVTTATPSVTYNGVTVNIGIGQDVCASFSEDCSTDALVAQRVAFGFNNIKDSTKFGFVAKADGATVSFLRY
jgi:hypothetical protein